MKRLLLAFVLLIIISSASLAQTIAGGGAFTLSLCNDGTVKSWGNNNKGQLGDGTTTNRPTPDYVSGLTNVIAIAAGSENCLALKSNGTVHAWGWNLNGQLGDGTTIDRRTPVQVINLAGITTISSGGYHSMALKYDGTVWTWGNNGYGQLGDGTTTHRNTPVKVNGLTDIIAIAGGAYHSIALKSDGTVWTWGYNYYGQLGDSTSATWKSSPVQVKNLTGVIDIAGGIHHCIALKNDGTIWSWGYNIYGQLGDATNVHRNVPVQAQNLTGVIAISSGAHHNIALKNDSTVWAWGQNVYGQIGDGTLSITGCMCKLAPVQVSGLTGVIDINNGYYHNIALKSDGTTRLWGYNNSAQLGDGTTTDRPAPVPPVNLCQVALAGGLIKGVYGEVYNDINQNCIIENESLLAGRKLLLNPGNIVLQTSQYGYWYIDSLPAGNYTITADTSGKWRRTCALTQSFTITNPDSFYVAPSFGFVSTQPCADPLVSVNMPRMRPGFSNQPIYVQACNEYKATGALTNGYIELELDPQIIPQSASVSYTSLGGNKYKIVLANDTLNPGQCETITMNCSLSTSAVLNSTLCIKANLFPADSCVFDTIPNTVTGVTPCTLPWDKSSLKVTGTCTGDSIRFVVYNHGSGSMQCYAPVRIYVDGVLITLDSIMLTSGDSAVYTFLGDGRTWRLEADQHPLHPGRSHPNATVENCNPGTWTPNLVNVLPQDDADGIVDIFCGQVRGSYDPNDKTGYPLGINSTHDIMPNQQLEYVIRFQNTGTDTAFTVVIRDTLDTDLDIFSVVSGVSSHKYKFKMYGKRVLEWTFTNILLPDSNVNEAKSHGFVTFTVEQNRNLANGTLLENTAGIYFDFNAPVITNTTVHTVNEEVQSVVNSNKLTLRQAQGDKLRVYPNPAKGQITVRSSSFVASSANVEIYNAIGVVVKTLRQAQRDSSVVIDISDLPRGMYIVKAGAEAVKLVVE